MSTLKTFGSYLKYMAIKKGLITKAKLQFIFLFLNAFRSTKNTSIRRISKMADDDKPQGTPQKLYARNRMQNKKEPKRIQFQDL